MADPFATLPSTFNSRYRILSEIGRGGMSIVYRAHDLEQDRDVAVKVLRPDIASIMAANRFLQEIRIDAALQHPNILPLLDSGEVDGYAYCVFPFVDGPTLRQRLTSGPLPVDEAVRIAIDLAEALGHAHEAGFVHRDLKPENVLLSSGRALLLDFGVARAVAAAAGDRLTSEGIAVGTPKYMSPEQASGTIELDRRSDIYSLGVVLFEMLAGEPPFGGQTPQAVFARHLVETAPPVSALRPPVDAGLDRVVQKALAKAPVDRYATTTELIHALTHRAEFQASLVRRKRWRPYLTAALVLLVPAALLLLARRLVGTPTLDATRVVVFPFPDQGSRGEKPTFSTDIPYAIELALDHSAPLRWVHGWNWLDEDVRRDPVLLTGPRMRRLARDLRARYYIDGAIQRSTRGTQLVLQLHDAAADSTVVTEGVTATGDAASDLPGLAVQAVSKLLLRWLTPGRHEALANLATRHPGAVALQVQGEDAYRRARFAQALALFERSIAVDTTWGYAAVKAAQAASWLARRDEGLRHIKLALRHSVSLPRQYAAFAQGLEAYLEGRADDAVDALRRSLALAPEWEEAHAALGEVYYHLLPSRGDPQALAQASFEAALVADSNFVPAARHVAEINFRNGDLDRGDKLLGRLRAEQADSETTRTLTLMRDCLSGQGTDSAWRALALRDPISVLGAGQQLAAGAARVPCAERLYRVLLSTRGLPEGFSWTALRGLQGLMIATGRSEEAAHVLDSAFNAGEGAVRFLYLLGAGEAPPLDSRARETADFARANYGPHYAAAPPLTQWALAVWHARRGDAAVVAQIRGDSTASSLITDAIAAHAALAQRDTSRAINQLLALKSTARVDDLDGDLFAPLALERIALAELLLAKGRYQEAHDAMTPFDNANVAFTPFVARSLAIRTRAMAALGDGKAANYRRRLSTLGRADLLGQRR